MQRGQYSVCEAYACVNIWEWKERNHACLLISLLLVLNLTISFTLCPGISNMSRILEDESFYFSSVSPSVAPSVLAFSTQPNQLPHLCLLFSKHLLWSFVCRIWLLSCFLCYCESKCISPLWFLLLSYLDLRREREN